MIGLCILRFNNAFKMLLDSPTQIQHLGLRYKGIIYNELNSVIV